jgi:hypothetical protein
MKKIISPVIIIGYQNAPTDIPSLLRKYSPSFGELFPKEEIHRSSS